MFDTMDSPGTRRRECESVRGVRCRDGNPGILSLVLTFLAAVVSCTTSCQPPSEYGEVRGRITVGGEPLAGAQVLFMPPSDRVATGVTDENGNYQLSTRDVNDGAVFGRHLVAIMHRRPIRVSPADILPGSDLNRRGIQKDAGDDEWASPLPLKYADSNAPILSALVEPGENRIDFDLESTFRKPAEAEVTEAVGRGR